MIRHQFGQVQFASEHWFRLAATTLATRHRFGRPGDGRQAGGRPRPSDRSRLDPGPDRQHRPRPARGDDQAGPARPRLRRRPGRPRPGRQPAQRRAGRPQRERRRGAPAGLPGRGRGGQRGPRPARGPRRDHRQPGRRADRPDAPRLRRGRGRRGLQRRPAQRDGGARVRPEREAAPGLLGAREPGLSRRARPAHRRAAAGSTSSSATRTPRPRCARCRSSWRRTVAPAAPSASSGVLGPTRMSYSHAIGTVGFVSGLMNELVDHLYA